MNVIFYPGFAFNVDLILEKQYRKATCSDGVKVQAQEFSLRLDISYIIKVDEMFLWNESGKRGLRKYLLTMNRSRHTEVFCKRGVLSNFAKFTVKLRLRPATLFKKRLWHRCFPVNFEKFLRTSFLTEHLQ